jgi:hypothetical protein
MQYAEMFTTDQSICDEVLTNEVMEEIGKCKAKIIAAVLPYWQNITGDDDPGVLAIELEPMTPDFIRALVRTLAAPPLARAMASLQLALGPNTKPGDDEDEGDVDPLDDEGDDSNNSEDEGKPKSE